MLHYAVVFFVIALVASLLGFGGVAGMSMQIGWIFAVVAVIFLAVAVLGGRVAARMAPVGRTCMYNGATVATESSICKGGIAFRCEDGEWRNLGTACQ